MLFGCRLSVVGCGWLCVVNGRCGLVVVRDGGMVLEMVDVVCVTPL